MSLSLDHGIECLRPLLQVAQRDVDWRAVGAVLSESDASYYEVLRDYVTQSHPEPLLLSPGPRPFYVLTLAPPSHMYDFVGAIRIEEEMWGLCLDELYWLMEPDEEDEDVYRRKLLGHFGGRHDATVAEDVARLERAFEALSAVPNLRRELLDTMYLEDYELRDFYEYLREETRKVFEEEGLDSSDEALDKELDWKLSAGIEDMWRDHITLDPELAIQDLSPLQVSAIVRPEWPSDLLGIELEVVDGVPTYNYIGT